MPSFLGELVSVLAVAAFGLYVQYWIIRLAVQHALESHRRAG